MSLIQPKTALVSLSDKTGLNEIVKYLTSKNVKILSTGGTYIAIREICSDVIEVSENTSDEHIEREIALVKIKDKSISKEMMDKFSKNEFLKIHTTNSDEIIIECVDSPEKINNFLDSVKKIAVKIVRSGSVGINSN